MKSLVPIWLTQEERTCDCPLKLANCSRNGKSRHLSRRWRLNITIKASPRIRRLSDQISDGNSGSFRSSMEFLPRSWLSRYSFHFIEFRFLNVSGKGDLAVLSIHSSIFFSFSLSDWRLKSTLLPKLTKMRWSAAREIIRISFRSAMSVASTKIIFPLGDRLISWVRFERLSLLVMVTLLYILVSSCCWWKTRPYTRHRPRGVVHYGYTLECPLSQNINCTTNRPIGRRTDGRMVGFLESRAVYWKGLPHLFCVRPLVNLYLPYSWWFSLQRFFSGEPCSSRLHWEMGKALLRLRPNPRNVQGKARKGQRWVALLLVLRKCHHGPGR